MVLNNTNKNNSILLEVFASVFTLSSYFTDIPRMCRHMCDWNIVNCDVKQQIHLTSLCRCVLLRLIISVFNSLFLLFAEKQRRKEKERRQEEAMLASWCLYKHRTTIYLQFFTSHSLHNCSPFACVEWYLLLSALHILHYFCVSTGLSMWHIHYYPNKAYIQNTIPV